MKSLYEQLGVTPQASLKAIQQSFFRLAKKFDPSAPGNHGNPGARDQYLALHDAYRTLSDPEMRRKYDDSLHGLSLAQRAKAMRAMRSATK